MLFEEEDAPLLKKWIVNRLENTSDADADVLADYVLALLRHDGNDETIRALCESEIPDFLKEDSVLFVRDVFDAVNYKTYLPGATSRKPSLPFNPPTGPSAIHNGNLGLGFLAGPPSGARKRPYNDKSIGQVYERGFPFNNNLNESNKFQRRVGPSLGRGNIDTGRGGHIGARQTPIMNHQNIPSQYPGMQGISHSSPRMPTFDPNDPMTAMLAMQALGFPLPGTSTFDKADLSHGESSIPLSKQKCRDYDVKGFCARGITCTYEHGENSIWGPPQPKNLTEEYDPTNSIMNPIDLNGGERRGTVDNDIIKDFQTHSEGRRKIKPRRGDTRNSSHTTKRGGRSEFSSDRPNYDKNNTTIVVENIPEEKFTEDEVRGFFSEFGNITDISMRLYKRLAIVKYESWNSANLAYKSPKVIFDNRFVKVYWFQENDSQLKQSANSESGSRPSNLALSGAPVPARDTSESNIDLEEFTRKQQEAQEAHIKKQKKKIEMEAAKKELEKRQEDLLKCQAEEKRKLMERIAAKDGKSKSDENSRDSSGLSDKAQSQTEILKAQLAALEAEAQSLGIDTSLSDVTPWFARGRGRGRGQYRGRGGYRGRGTLSSATTFIPSNRSFNLDNRPKKIGMIGVDFTNSINDENLKQYLLGIGEYEEIEATPSRTIITFKDRRTAEKFMYSTTDGEIPSVGKVDMTWVPVSLNSTFSHLSDNSRNGTEVYISPEGERTAPVTNSGEGNDSNTTFKSDNQQNANSNVDYDVAYENEWEPE